MRNEEVDFEICDIVDRIMHLSAFNFVDSQSMKGGAAGMSHLVKLNFQTKMGLGMKMKLGGNKIAAKVEDLKNSYQSLNQNDSQDIVELQDKNDEEQKPNILK